MISSLQEQEINALLHEVHRASIGLAYRRDAAGVAADWLEEYGFPNESLFLRSCQWSLQWIRGWYGPCWSWQWQVESEAGVTFSFLASPWRLKYTVYCQSEQMLFLPFFRLHTSSWPVGLTAECEPNATGTAFGFDYPGFIETHKPWILAEFQAFARMAITKSTARRPVLWTHKTKRPRPRILER